MGVEDFRVRLSHSTRPFADIERVISCFPGVRHDLRTMPPPAARIILRRLIRTLLSLKWRSAQSHAYRAGLRYVIPRRSMTCSQLL